MSIFKKSIEPEFLLNQGFIGYDENWLKQEPICYYHHAELNIVVYKDDNDVKISLRQDKTKSYDFEVEIKDIHYSGGAIIQMIAIAEELCHLKSKSRMTYEQNHKIYLTNK